jgi:CheY-like chemotaxis protein
MEKDFSAQYFLSSLSHQIRTPLNGIIGYSQLLSQTKLDKTQQSYVNSMNSCSLQLICLINDILDFSKLTTGKAQVKNECFSFNEVVEEVNAAIGFRVKEKKQKLRYVIEKNVPEYIISDKQKIIQILINLVSNANKFSPVDSRIIVGISNGNSGTIKITVEDNGIGIPLEEQKKLFNAFVQVQDSLTKNGSGLGLAICKKLVELLGGTISVESDVGQGSIFFFTIKYECYEEFKKSVEKNGEILKNKSILIADSNIDVRLSLGEILFDIGMRPVICSSAKETLRMIIGKRYTFSAILLDICISDMPGTQLAKQIKEIDPEIPLVALSSLEESFDSSNFDKVIHKPVNRVKLLDNLYKIINKDDITPYQLNEVEPVLKEVCKKEINILIAEDVSYNLEMLVKMLDTMGYKNVDTAKDGEEAISKINETKVLYDIILLDLKMPKKTGFEVAEYIKNKGLTCKVAVLSASVLDNDRDKCKDLEIKYFLLKPFSMANLKIMMNRLVNGTNPKTQ